MALGEKLAAAVGQSRGSGLRRSAFKHKLFHAAQTHGEDGETAACEYQ